MSHVTGINFGEAMRTHEDFVRAHYQHYLLYFVIVLPSILLVILLRIFITKKSCEEKG